VLTDVFLDATMQANVGVKRFSDIDMHLRVTVAPDAADE